MTRLVSQNKIAPGRKRDGATAVLMVFVLAIIIGMTAFGTEVGRMYALRSEMQNAVDAGAVAANLQLRYDPSDLPAAQAKAEQFIQLNRVGMTETVPSDSITATMGDWDDDTRTFTATNTDPNAVQVSAQQVNEPFFFGRIFGHTTFGAPGAAVASGGSKPMDIMMVLDLSGSMSSNGRIQALQNSAPIFVDVVEDLGQYNDPDAYDRIGVMGLSADPSEYDPSAQGHSGTLYLSGGYPSNNHHVGILEAGLTQNFSALRTSTLTSSVLFAAKYKGTGSDGYTGTG
ncbi:MAG: TadE/TadG family type IV pilus assembly protein, partial [Pirellulales bacterium]